MKTKLHVLIIEDNESDAALALRSIEQGAFHVIARQVMTKQDMVSALKDQIFDIILADYNVPGFGAKEALIILKESQLDIPFVLISGTVGEETAVEMMKLGVHDYIMKDNLIRLASVVTRELQEAANRRQKRSVQLEQREFINVMKMVQQMTHLGTWTWSITSGQVEWSDELYLIYEKDKSTFQPSFENYLDMVHPDDRIRVKETIYASLSDLQEISFDERIVLSDNKVKVLQSWATVILDDNQQPVKMYGACLDVTNSKSLQTALDLSKERLKSIVDNNIDIISLLDENGVILFESESIFPTLGYDCDELIGKNALAYVHAEDHERVMNQLLTLRKIDNSSITIQFRFLHKLGHYVNIEVRTTNQLNNPSINAIIVNSRDITERLIANQAILESQQQIKEVSESIPGAVFQFHYTQQARIELKYISDGIYQLVGLMPAELYADLGKGLSQIKNSHKEELEVILENAHTNQIPLLCYFQLYDLNGFKRWIRCNAIPKLLEDQSTLWNGTLIDVSDAKNAEQALQVNQENLEIEKRRLNQIIEGTNVGTWEYSIQTGDVYINERWAEIIGYSRSEIGALQFQQLKSYIHPDDLLHAITLLKTHLEGRSPNYQCETRLIHKEGHAIWVMNKGKVVSWDANGKPTLLSGSCEDITDQKNTENLILRSAVAAEEKERERLSKELHDGIAQNMVAMALYLSNLANESKVMPQKAQDIIKQINELISDTIEETRQVSHDLMPRVLNEHGFIGAVETLFDRINRVDKLKYVINIKGSANIADPLISINLYRVIQEFIKNTQKYSEATQVMLNIEFKNDKLHIFISDDGLGFDRSLPSRGVGLQNMFSRINAIGGNYSLNTTPGQGVRMRISVQLPVKV